MIQWEGLNEFIAVAETESFTSAGQRLNISTAQVSRQVSAIESRLAVQLFYRTTRKVSLTESGRQLYRRCRPLLDALQEVQREVSEQQSLPRGHIRLTAPVNFGEQILAPLLAEFCATYAEVKADLVLSNQRLDLIEEGLDLAIRIGKLANSTMKARRLATRKLTLCASPGYLDRHGRPETLTDLAQHNCLAGTSNSWHFRDKNQPCTLKIQGPLRCNSGTVLLEAAKRGLGLVQLPDHYVTESLVDGTLVALLEAHQPEPEDIWALYPHNRHLSITLRRFIETVEAALLH